MRQKNNDPHVMGGGYGSRPKCSGLSSSYRQLTWPAPALLVPYDPNDNNSHNLIWLSPGWYGTTAIQVGVDVTKQKSVGHMGG